MLKISVCVPTYIRPDTLRQLINSYQYQDYRNKELIISDDSPNETIKKLILEFNDKSIKYFHNKKSLRFAGNLFASMKRASGDYLMVLGDDDVLLSVNVLSQYAKVFEKYPKVGFIYSNMVQFSDSMNVEYIINFTEEDRIFKNGEDSMKNIWPRSLFIGGIGIRNSKKILDFFPTKKNPLPTSGICRTYCKQLRFLSY